MSEVYPPKCLNCLKWVCECEHETNEEGNKDE